MIGESLNDIVARAKLPIGVSSVEHPDGALLVVTDIPAGGGYCLATFDPAGATRAYFDLVSKLQSVPASPPLAGTATDCSASVHPLGGV